LALNPTRRAQLSLRIIVTLIVHFVLARNDDERGCRAASIHRQNANSVLRSLRVHLSLANSAHYSVQSKRHGRLKLHYMYVSVTCVIVVPVAHAFYFSNCILGHRPVYCHLLLYYCHQTRQANETQQEDGPSSTFTQSKYNYLHNS
jgi:hypothetical protein